MDGALCQTILFDLRYWGQEYEDVAAYAEEEATSFNGRAKKRCTETTIQATRTIALPGLAKAIIRAAVD